MVKCGTSMKKNYPKNINNDYLTPLLIKAPATWALIRANEIRALDRVTFKHPVLDVGCGDGFVAKVILSSRKDKFDVGLDLSESEISYARKSGSYKKTIVGNVYSLPFGNEAFSTVFSNSVIEHIPDLDKSLSEISRVLKPGGEFIITVPTPYLTKYLLGYRFFNSIGSSFLAKLYGRFFNRLFYHLNLYTDKQWRLIFKEHQLRLTEHYYYHTPSMIEAHEILAYLAIPYHLTKFIFGHWVVFPELRKHLVVPWLKKLLNRYYVDDVKKDEGGSVLLIARKEKVA